MNVILGISAYYHDSAAALLVDGEISFAVQEERLTRKRHDPSFPSNAIRACLDHAARSGRPLKFSDLQAIVFYDKPFLKFERLLETYYGVAPRGYGQFLSAMPVWLGEKLFLKSLIFSELNKILPAKASEIRLLFSEHHLSHAASAYYPSCFQDAAILTVDGVGEWATASIAKGHGNQISILRELRYPHSLGLLYSAFTYYTGFRVNSGEYKLMGLAPYGDAGSSRTRRYIDSIYQHLVDVKEDGSIWLNQDYFEYSTGLRMVNDRRWQQLFGISARIPEGPVSQEYCDLALAIQTVTEDIVLKLAKEAKRLTSSAYLCMAGGVALNCVANGALIRSGLFKNIWIQPAAGDAGGALGAALAVHHMYFEKPKKAFEGDLMQGAYLGPEYDEVEIRAMAMKYGAVFERLTDEELLRRTAKLIADGMVVGWHQGRAEFGPRALGNRSILGDPRNPAMQKKLNLKIKFRESFRPFAPSVLAEDCAEFFEGGYVSPYMLLIDYVNTQRRRERPDNYSSMDLRDKLYQLRSDLPAITHLDYSARVETVHHETNPRYHALLEAFKKITGYGILVNTSFNVRGEPIVCTPEDSYKCFMRTEMDYLVIGNCFFEKQAQPQWPEENWKSQYALD